MAKTADPDKNAEMVIFTRMLELLMWLLPHCDHFPKAQRFTITARMQAALLDLLERLYDANAHSGEARLALLLRADAELAKLRVYLRVAHQLGWLTDSQLEHVAKLVAEIGRLLGGWLRQTRATGAKKVQA